MEDNSGIQVTWEAHSTHFQMLLYDMMTLNRFTDVTLVTDDQMKILAHRNILSACSPVFQNILESENHSNHPVIYLRGIMHKELQSIVQFMYLGQTTFKKDDIREFLSVASNLQVNEICQSLATSDFLSEDYIEDDKTNVIDSAQIFNIKSKINPEGQSNQKSFNQKEKLEQLNESTNQESEHIIESFHQEADQNVESNESINQNSASEEVSETETLKESSASGIHVSEELVKQPDLEEGELGIQNTIVKLENETTETETVNKNEDFPERKIQCQNCTKEFDTIAELKRHCKYGHKGESICLACNYCDLKINQSKYNTSAYKGPQYNALKYHILTKHKLKSTKLEELNKKSGVEEVVKEKKDVKIFKYWNNDYSNGQKVNKDGNGKEYPCKECDQKFQKPWSLQRHRKNVHKGITYPCDQCDYKAKEKHHLKEHINAAHEKIKSQCEYCEYTTTSASAIIHHTESQHTKEEFACEHCDFVSHRGRLRYHIRNEHSEIYGLFPSYQSVEKRFSNKESK